MRRFWSSYRLSSGEQPPNITPPQDSAVPPPLGTQPSQPGNSYGTEANPSSNWSPRQDDASSSEYTSSTRPGSIIFPEGDFRNGTPDHIQDIRCEVVVNWLHSKQEERIWTAGGKGEGVMLKKSKGQYVCCPSELEHDGSLLFEMAAQLNVRVAMTVNTRVIKLLLARTDAPYVQLNASLRLQVLPNIQALPFCQKNQSAAFIASRQILVVWEDEPKRLLERAQYIQDTLMKMIWGNTSGHPEDGDTKEAFIDISPIEDLEVTENGQPKEEQLRRPVLIQSVLTAATLILMMAAVGSGCKQVAIEMAVDTNWIRLAFLGCILPQIWLALFFFQALVGNIAQMFGPISQVRKNTKFYSGQAPKRLRRAHGTTLPHLTVQMPVYREGLRTVIEPTVRSVKAAISTYEMQGGTANMFINDDGMQTIPEKEAKERQDFYDENNIGWVARPKHNPKARDGETAFIRRGKFKKASNMNYALSASIKVEDILLGLDRHDGWTERDEHKAYGEAVRQVTDASDGEIWVDGNIRIGDYVLLIDSDTRVPTDCLLEAVSEMEQSPEVAIIQYASGVMNVTQSFFEKGITFFTNLIYTQIQYAVANGDIAPFVGHNAILRWSAIQEVAYDCKDDSNEKYWSENTVSEDFDMALRLQTNGYLIRLATYKGRGFKEGVSLTVYDELARWEKYAYGCSELIFHPLRFWVFRGPFTPLFRQFMGSSMPLPAKVTIMAYIGTYYALGSAWILTLANYFLVGWFNGHLDHYYLDSFKIYFSIVTVFTALGNLALAVLRYRLGEGGIGHNLWENLKWVPLLVVFLGGISLHISQALLCHMFGINLQWGATAKEVDNVSFFEEIPRVLRRFKWTFLWALLTGAMMACMAYVVWPEWRITFFTPVWPLVCVVVSHFLLPIVLNPNLMRFTW
ncbi:glycosyl transferase family group 2-domain-containing protein [Massariosphaeria phaeospora]|uniref:Glycosyl transferase family group 2-domain-containing protein n=1 Tax=Massariosphaeria phaeospora TaxID=100035 RepID=A0A7C8I7S9_9PLEO|nr:glycosyl transferase family group 2-domain-containing protein [Massariosphaeria phaeospora]